MDDKKLTELCKVYLKRVCLMRDSDMDKYIHMEEPFKVYGKKDRYFGKDPRYAAPVGWCHLKLKRLEDDPIPDTTWDFGYHGTQSKFVLSILQNRLVVPGTKLPSGVEVKIQPGHIPEQNHIYTSPCFHYSSHYVYAWPNKWEYEGKRYYVRVVFQIKQKCGTYRISRNTLGHSCWDPNVAFDDYFKNEELEWITDDPHGIIVEGLLLHFSEEDVHDVVKRRELERKKYRPAEKTLPDDRADFQISLDSKKNKVLWVDDNPTQNLPLIFAIEGRNAVCVCKKDTGSALMELKEHGNEFFAIITDLGRKESRNGNPPKQYDEAGIDFARAARKMGIEIPIFMYSSYCRSSGELCHKVLDSGVTKIVDSTDLQFLIRKDICPKK